jgi:hypothetical protein
VPAGTAVSVQVSTASTPVHEAPTVAGVSVAASYRWTT